MNLLESSEIIRDNPKLRKEFEKEWVNEMNNIILS